VDINEVALSLWKNAPSKFKGWVPLLYNKQHSKPSVIFMGLNPSLSNKGLSKIIKGEKHLFGMTTRIFLSKNFTLKIKRTILEIEALAIQRHDYFSKFHEIGREQVFKWNHIDLFFVRNTNQKVIEKEFKNAKNSVFFQNQMISSIKYVLGFKPKVIVVCNAFASTIIKQRYCATLKFDSRVGAYKFGNRKKSPYVIFSSMLTGGRALDNGSYASLKWHLNLILNSF